MNRFTPLGVAVLLASPDAATAAQVSKTITGETRTMSATVESVEQSTRAVTVKKANGEYEVLYCPPALKRCDTLKVGDRINAKYYETVVLRLKLPGEPDQNTSAAARIPSEQGPLAPCRASEPSRLPSAPSTRRFPLSVSSGPRGGNTAAASRTRPRSPK